ncbi:UDP-glucuronosyltransferase [Trichostrongylus colubriformis]|uniref:glucuronosyltransferase n=1 Tax=Trichostrongylus colubriformis TaxID=6319 RepID=A0AAN8FPY1_TRICO
MIPSKCIQVPLFADQIRNANMLAKHGGAIVLQKYDLITSRRLITAIKSIIHDKRYSTNAKILADILVNQPMSPKQMMLRHAEFTARFGRIPNLDPYGRHLTTLQYYLIDIFLLVVVTAVSTVCISYYILKAIYRMTSFKLKAD